MEAGGQPKSRRRARRAALALGAVALVLGVVGYAAAGWGSFETWPAPREITPEYVAAAPAWTRPCWARRLRSSRVTTVRCARLRGRVIFRRREKDRNGGDVHLVTVADRHIVYAKISPEDQRLGIPSIGDRVTFVGPIVRGAHVDEQVRAWRIVNHGL